MNDLSVFPHVYAPVHSFVFKPRSCCRAGSAPPLVSVPAPDIFLSRVQFCTSSDIYLLKRIIQLIIAFFILPHRPKCGQIRRETSVFRIQCWLHGAKRHKMKQYRRCCPVRTRSEKWRRRAEQFLFNMVHISLPLPSHLPDAFLSGVLAFLWTSAFIRMLLTM